MVSGEMEPLIVTFPVTLPVPVSVLSAANAGTTAVTPSTAKVTMPARALQNLFFIEKPPCEFFINRTVQLITKRRDGFCNRPCRDTFWLFCYNT